MTHSDSMFMDHSLVWKTDNIKQTFSNSFSSICLSHPTKIDINKKWLPKKKTIQNFNIDAQGFRKIRNENPPTQEIGVTS